MFAFAEIWPVPPIAVCIGWFWYRGALDDWLVRQQSDRDAVILVAWMLAAALGVLVQGHFYEYTGCRSIPPQALLAGIGLDALWIWVTDDGTVRSSSLATTERVLRDLPVVTSIAVTLAAVVLLGAVTGPFLHVYRLSGAVVTGDLSDYERIEFGPFAHQGGVFPSSSTTFTRGPGRPMSFCCGAAPRA